MRLFLDSRITFIFVIFVLLVAENRFLKHDNLATKNTKSTKIKELRKRADEKGGSFLSVKIENLRHGDSAAGAFGQVQNVGDSQTITESLEVAERPDDLFVAGHLEQLRILRTRVAVAHDHISIGKRVQCCNPGQGDSWQLALFDAPDNL